MTTSDGTSAHAPQSGRGTVVLVHGAWHGGWCFGELVDELAARGVGAAAPDLPGHGANADPQGDVVGDASAIRAVLAELSGPVVLLGHSYGGAVITQVMADEAARAKVGHLVYLCAMMVPAGQSFFSFPLEVHRGSLLGPLMIAAENGLTAIDLTDLAAAKAAFYADCSDEQVQRAAANLCLQNANNFAAISAITAAAHTSTTYVACTEDRAIPITAQRAMIEAVSAEAPQLEVVELATSHSPFLSDPSAIADILQQRLMSLSS